ncbi:MAG: outer membrane lipid asymmetry maintenance protein MlaD [Rhodospirillaceae bacterium]|nr:outer membrane lipid asymmetry maintenance protein MlaD [Rhodospirillaceae bacterium]
MKRNPIETVLGAVVLVIAGMFMAFAYTTADIQAITGYGVTAKFIKVGGLETGSDVRISGIRVGTVTGQSLDPATYQATVAMSISGDVKLPQDTEAAIVSDGLLGGKYVNLIPGKATQAMADGGVIAKTRAFQSVEDLVGEIIFLATKKPEEKAANE